MTTFTVNFACETSVSTREVSLALSQFDHVTIASTPWLSTPEGFMEDIVAIERCGDLPIIAFAMCPDLDDSGRTTIAVEVKDDCSDWHNLFITDGVSEETRFYDEGKWLAAFVRANAKANQLWQHGSAQDISSAPHFMGQQLELPLG